MKLNWKTKAVGGIMAFAVIALFAIVIWPTPYRYGEVYESGYRFTIRENRITGETQRFSRRNGWARMRAEEAEQQLDECLERSEGVERQLQNIRESLTGRADSVLIDELGCLRANVQMCLQRLSPGQQIDRLTVQLLELCMRATCP